LAKLLVFAVERSMKQIKVTDVGQLKNELNKYKKGKKLDIRHFNQVARLAWLGKITMSRLDPEDPDCRAYLLHVEYPGGLAEHFIDLDEDLMSQIHILDGEQGDYIAQVLKDGMAERIAQLKDLNRRDFYFGKFFKPEQGKSPAGEDESQQ
jgi:hypothetical protein